MSGFTTSAVHLQCFIPLQVCAALAPSVHATTSELLLPDAPPNYLCPISKQVMIEPVLLVETGHTYEASAIHKWLDTSDVCPMNGQRLRSKQTAPNFTLKSLIAEWATTHCVTLPSAPSHTKSGRSGTLVEHFCCAGLTTTSGSNGTALTQPYTGPYTGNASLPAAAGTTTTGTSGENRVRLHFKIGQ